MNIPNLNNLINAIECEGIFYNGCKRCPYGYQYWDDSGDNGIWTCDEAKKERDILFYLKLYQYLIKEQSNG
jgi:hypothetical protein